MHSNAERMEIKRTNTKMSNHSNTKTDNSSKKELKVLFVASGNKTGGNVSSFVRSQYESLVAAGLDMRLFPVSGHGWRAYLKGVWRLRQMVRREKPDIIHAHYSTCGFVASLACLGLWHRPKIMVSILGSFPARNAKWRRVRWAIQHLWDGALTKSERTRNQLGLDLPVIPNGVNLEVFHLIDQFEARKKVGFDIENEVLEPVVSDAERIGTDTPTSTKCEASNTNHAVSHKYIIWCSNPERREKNWPLAESAVNQLQITNNQLQISLVPVYDKTPDEVCMYMNAADCLLLTSVSEGSPNVIKEAMACNCPIVTTDVGDVNERLHDLDGCYVAPSGDLSFVICNLAAAIVKALEFGKRTEGRKRIIADGLTIELTAQKIIKWYGI